MLIASGTSRRATEDVSQHSHGYIWSLPNAETPIKTHQTLPRHAQARLPINTYGHVSLFDTFKAIRSLCPPQWTRIEVWCRELARIASPARNRR